MLSEFLDAMLKRGSQFIFMPTNSTDISTTKSEFYDIAGFAGVLGDVDGSHFPIIAPPGDDEKAYVNRKNFHSINVQVVCDANLVFLDVCARCPGSAHDSFICNAAVQFA